MKMIKITTIKNIFAIIQLVALLQLASSFIGPHIWKGQHSDLRSNIALGGEVATEQFGNAENQATRSVITWGAGFACAVFVAATIGSRLCRKPKEE